MKTMTRTSTMIMIILTICKKKSHKFKAWSAASYCEVGHAGLVRSVIL